MSTCLIAFAVKMLIGSVALWVGDVTSWRGSRIPPGRRQLFGRARHSASRPLGGTARALVEIGGGDHELGGGDLELGEQP
jgi:hypothetical protein